MKYESGYIFRYGVIVKVFDRDLIRIIVFDIFSFTESLARPEDSR